MEAGGDLGGECEKVVAPVVTGALGVLRVLRIVVLDWEVAVVVVVATVAGEMKVVPEEPT